MAQSELRAVRKAAERFGRARLARDEAILAAHLSGETVRTIAEYALISHQRVSVIVRRELKRRSE